MLCYKSKLYIKYVPCLFKYSLTGAVLIQVTEWMKIKPTFTCAFILRPLLQGLTWHKNNQCDTSRMFSHSHLKLNVNENVGCIQEKNGKETIETHCKFKII